MNPLPFLILPICLETATTVGKEKLKWNDYISSELIVSQPIFNNLDMSKIIDIKNNKLTTVILETENENTTTSSDFLQGIFSGNYEVHIPLIINKTFHFKGKIKSISRYKPSIHI